MSSAVIFIAAVGMGLIADVGPEPGTLGRYRVLSCTVRKPPPFEAVELHYGPAEVVDGVNCQAWQMTLRPQEGGEDALVRVRVWSSCVPPVPETETVQVMRYQVQIPSTGESYEYRNLHNGRALLPPWKDFTVHFIPRRVRASGSQDGVAHTAAYLGHVLTLRSVHQGVPWEPWPAVKTLVLDPELLIGTGRDFRDQEGRRLPMEPVEQDYTYVPFTPEDYRTMIETGMNLFIVSPANARLVQGEPVFYHRRAGGDPPLHYPADLYRSNYLGPVMFMDEPSIILTGDPHINTVLKHWSDFPPTIRGRVRSAYLGTGNYGAFFLEAELLRRGISLGDMRLMQHDYPSWETILETTFYQMEGGCNGLVHEGRYNLADFAGHMDRWLGRQRPYTPEEYLRFQFALLRGGTRPFGKYWGTAIYGQADPDLSPLAVTLAYDMGARYVWYWTSDHAHHLPWHEQLALTRHLREHIARRPRSSIATSPPQPDLAIVIPYGYFLWLGHESSNPHANLWWIRELDVATHQNESSRRFSRLMRRAVQALVEAFDRREDFDITIDDGRQISGYRRVLRLSDEQD